MSPTKDCKKIKKTSLPGPLSSAIPANPLRRPVSHSNAAPPEDLPLEKNGVRHDLFTSPASTLASKTTKPYARF